MGNCDVGLTVRNFAVSKCCVGSSLKILFKVSTALLLGSIVFLGFSESSMAHEAWVLTPEQFAEWNSKPRPELFTSLNFTNSSLLLVSLGFISWIIYLEQKKVRHSIKPGAINLAQYTDVAVFGVRIAMAIMMGMAAFGLSPRHGTELFEASTLVAPDLEIRLLGEAWIWMAWAQGIGMITLLLGIYVRITAAIILSLNTLGLFLFGYEMLAYAGIVGGVGLFLLLSGPGTYKLKVPELKAFKSVEAFFEKQTIYRAQFLIRVLAGANLIYLGIEYKFRQPNLSLAFIEMQNVFTFGLSPEMFVFGMFLVETLAGILMVLGMMMRPLSVVLLIAFMFLAWALGENPLGHIIFYGILWSCFIIGAGHWALRKKERNVEHNYLQESPFDSPVMLRGKS